MDKFLRYVLSLTLALCILWGVIVLAGPSIIMGILSNQFGDRLTLNGVSVTPRLTLRVNNLQMRDAKGQENSLIARAVDVGWSLERGNLIVSATAGHVSTTEFIARELNYSSRVFLNALSPTKLTINKLSLGSNTLRDVSATSEVDLIDLMAHDFKIGLAGSFALQDFVIDARATFTGASPVPLEDPTGYLQSQSINFDIVDLVLLSVVQQNTNLIKEEIISSASVDQSISGGIRLGADFGVVSVDADIQNVGLADRSLSVDIGAAKVSLGLNSALGGFKASIKPARLAVSFAEYGLVDLSETPVEFHIKSPNQTTPQSDYSVLFTSDPPLSFAVTERKCIDAQCRLWDIIASAGEFVLPLEVRCVQSDCYSRFKELESAEANVFGFGQALAQTGLVDPLTIMQAYSALQ